MGDHLVHGRMLRVEAAGRAEQKGAIAFAFGKVTSCTLTGQVDVGPDLRLGVEAGLVEGLSAQESDASC